MCVLYTYLLCSDYVKHLPEDSKDREDSESMLYTSLLNELNKYIGSWQFCSEALEAISSTATHVNETIRQMVSGSYGAPSVLLSYTLWLYRITSVKWLRCGRDWLVMPEILSLLHTEYVPFVRLCSFYYMFVCVNRSSWKRESYWSSQGKRGSLECFFWWV